MNTSTQNWDTRTTELELPEEIDLQVEVANVGSRTLAILLDLAMGGLVLFIVYSLTLLFARNMTEDWMTKLSSSVLTTLLLLVVFGFQWVYFNIFEWLWNGQTPGKRLLHLRVIKVDGSPVSGIDVLLRNLARPIDTLGPMGLSIPTVIYGRNFTTRSVGRSEWTVVPFELDGDSIEIQISLAKRMEKSPGSNAKDRLSTVVSMEA